MTPLIVAEAIAFSTALVLFLVGFIQVAEALCADRMLAQPLVIGSVEIAGGTAIWFATLGVVGGAI